MSIVLISGNPSAGGRTSQLALDLGAALAGLLDKEAPAEVLELAPVAPKLFGWGDPDVAALKAQVLGADFVVIATPTYKAAMTGLLKSFLDQFKAGELFGQVVIPVFTGGSDAHSLAPDFTLRPVLQELGASMPTSSLYVVSSLLDGPNSVAAEFVEREKFRLLGAAHGMTLARG
ncbi:NAD(P)H-dependent oxidoreductase [Citreicella sp. C3M06]|uniref:NAD(P)H-dependent oxidoreductase n=1 Tax=Roseobacteraceae TaxID=2854170 RepID=UPI001C096FF1|nr:MULTISPECIES: NAD(P)H-dependent oxidoreductase [Roseobacteraceae]MBU2960158.1 NAD(P)H-dependent oxidoreductase [Citreicella sp. C3M06]MDO6586072.1 NAD(P)H-dependent oxidoreductase [Salipiger sp. 1_MG-2023]